MQKLEEVVERPPWRTVGHDYIGKSVRRFFPRMGDDGEEDDDGEGAEFDPATLGFVASDGKVVSWLPAEGDDDQGLTQ